MAQFRMGLPKECRSQIPAALYLADLAPEADSLMANQTEAE